MGYKNIRGDLKINGESVVTQIDNLNYEIINAKSQIEALKLPLSAIITFKLLTGSDIQICFEQLTDEDFICDWGDGTIDNNSNHTYKKISGKYEYTCRIYGITSFVKYSNESFDNNQSISKVMLLEPIKLIGDYAFEDCKKLTSIVIPDSVTSIGFGAFDGCDSLTSVVIPDSVTSIGEWAFYYCNSLTSVTIGNSVVSIGEWAFYDCDDLIKVTFKNAEPLAYEILWFANCPLTSIYVPYDCAEAYRTKWSKGGAPEEIINLIVESDREAMMSDLNAAIEGVSIDLNIKNGEGDYSLIQRVEDDTAPIEFTLIETSPSPNAGQTFIRDNQGKYSTLLGNRNHITAPNALVCGSGNVYDYEETTLEEDRDGRGIISGRYNHSRANDCLMFGAQNYLGTMANRTLVGGLGNYIGTNCRDSIIVGAHNRLNDNVQFCTISGVYNETLTGAHHSFVTGANNIVDAQYQAVFGSCSAENSDALFKIGNGSKASDGTITRKNIFEVLNNGDVKASGSVVLTFNENAGKYSGVFGRNNTVSNVNGNLITGYGNAIEGGGYLVVAGSSNTITKGGGSLVGGERNTISMGATMTVGASGKNSGYGSIMGGQTNNNSGGHALVIGKQNINTQANAIIGGMNNLDKEGILLALGNGTNTTSGRSNAFEVYGDGTAKLYGEPTADEDVVRMKELQTLEEKANKKVEVVEINNTLFNNEYREILDRAFKGECALFGKYNDSLLPLQKIIATNTDLDGYYILTFINIIDFEQPYLYFITVDTWERTIKTEYYVFATKEHVNEKTSALEARIAALEAATVNTATTEEITSIFNEEA